MSTENKKDELINQIGALILRDDKYIESEWAALSIVGKLRGGAQRVEGYVYYEDGRSEPRVPENIEFDEKLRDLRDTMHDVSGDMWKTCLIQIKKDDMSINVKFEYENEDKWADNDLLSMPDRLRPN